MGTWATYVIDADGEDPPAAYFRNGGTAPGWAWWALPSMTRDDDAGLAAAGPAIVAHILDSDVADIRGLTDGGAAVSLGLTSGWQEVPTEHGAAEHLRLLEGRQAVERTGLFDVVRELESADGPLLLLQCGDDPEDCTAERREAMARALAVVMPGKVG